MNRTDLLILVLLVFLIQGCTSVSHKTVDAEVRFNLYQDSTMDATIINRDNFAWTNMSVYADQYYKCTPVPWTTTLNPGDSVMLHTCEDSNGNIISSYREITINSDQGSNTYNVVWRE